MAKLRLNFSNMKREMGEIKKCPHCKKLIDVWTYQVDAEFCDADEGTFEYKLIKHVKER